MVSNRTGDFSDVHVLGPLDADVYTCSTGPDEGISLIPYLGSRKIYDKSAGNDYYGSFPPETEEKLRQMPAMLRAAHFARSGQQCYLPRREFQSLVKRDAKIDGTRNRSLQLISEEAEKNALSSEKPVQIEDFLPVTNEITNGALLSKSGSLISMTHIGTAPHAKIEELLEEDEENEEKDNKMQTEILQEILPVSEAETVTSQTAEIQAEDQPVLKVDNISEEVTRRLANGVNDSVHVNGTESGEEMVTESFAEVIPVKPVVPLFSKAIKRRLSRTIRGQFIFV